MRKLVAQVRPRLKQLAAAVGETVNLVERVGTSSRFLFSVEGPQLLRIGNRAGTVLPTHTSSGGQAALALLSASAVAQLYQGRVTQRAGGTLGAEELARLQGELAGGCRNAATP
ncbi:IclR family transcriptional regulator domain-containing protein [Paeniglutamicibacter quisquiliarum]|uniref:IclR family transcriptional regulator domain-containing protein n=1 Tax=Paeniglutamicibacter quisquiliarum TaxID=2849498 RepID=UPI003AB921FC